MDAGNGDPFGDGDRFHCNEAIAAVQDADQYLGEDDYEDYEDLYNDVNVGEGFLQSIPQPQEAASFPVKKKETEVGNSGAAAPRPPLPPQHPHPIDPPSGAPVSIPAEVKTERSDDDRSAAPAGFSNAQGYREAPAVLNKVGVGPGLRPPVTKPVETPPQFGNPGFGDEGFARQGVAGGGFGATAANGGVGGPSNYAVNVNGGASRDGGTTLYVGDLLWWTTDADLESELCKYGQVKEVKFFDEKASGKSKGYCQVDFYDPMAAAACKGGMNGHLFNGKPCVVAFATPFSVRRMGEAQLNKNHGSNANQTTPAHGRSRGGHGIPTGANYGGKSGGNWGRGGGGVGGRGNIRNRMGPSGGRGIIGNGGMNPPPPPVMHPGAMLSQSFDPTGYGAAMGRMGGFGGFPAGPTAPFPGMMPSFPPMVAPHVNPAFFGRGMAPAGVGMWQDPNSGMWGGEEQSNFGDDAASDQQYGEGSHGKDRHSDRDRSGALDRKPRDDREKDIGTGQDWSERRHHDDRGTGRENERERERERDRERDRERERDRDRGDRYRDDRDRYGDHCRQRDREIDRDDRGRSSSARSKPREPDYSKRRRITPE